MSAKLCPLCAPFIGKPEEREAEDRCTEEECAWWHGGLCDVSRIACSLAAIEVAELADTRDHITDHGESVLIGLNESYSGGDA